MGESLQNNFGADAGGVAKGDGQADQTSGSCGFHHYIRHGVELTQ